MISKQTPLNPRGLPASEGRYAAARRRGTLLNRILGSLLGPLAASLSACAARGRDRAHLASLDDRQLRDMGLERRMVADEGTVGYWRLR